MVEPRGHPLEDRGLDLDEDRRRLAHPDVAVGGAGDQIGRRGRWNPAPWNVGQVARSRSVERLADGGAETLEKSPQLLAAFGSRLVEALGQLEEVLYVGRGLSRERGDLLESEVGAAAEQLA